MIVHDTEDNQGNMVFESLLKGDITIEYIEHLFKKMISEKYKHDYEEIRIKHVTVLSGIEYYGEEDLGVVFCLVGRGGTSYLFDTYTYDILQRIREEKLEKILKE